MTLDYERRNAMKRLVRFARTILYQNVTEIRKNAKDIRSEASSCLRHAPSEEMFDYYFKDRDDSSQ